MKNIYIVLSFSGTMLSRAIKLYTKNEFSHISISLDKNLDQLYSFGRLNPYNPFLGGFVHEGINFGTFKRFRNTIVLVYQLPITDEQYNNLKMILTNINDVKETYKFNIIGLVAVALNKKIRFKNSFYCAEFVKYSLEKSGIKTNLPELVKPEDFKNLSGTKMIYKGMLRDYPASYKSKVEVV